MQARRAPGVSPLAIVVPHPALPRRRSRSSILSANSGSSPQTPRSCASPTCPSIFFTPSRKSTDSWNSSNADEIEWEWKPEQVLLLQRTLDALPAHLVTPFNGPIPPSNLLDKIARGVSQAKGPVDWPHSIRATRVKLIELSRLKAKEEALAEQRRRVITEEPEIEMDDGNYSYMHDGAERPITLGATRRPLHKQSSMDFIEPAGTDIKHNDNIARLSRRLQRTDRVFSNPAYHPYSRSTRAQIHRRSTSPPPVNDVPSLISPSTQSSDTLNSLSSFSSAPRIRRTTSSNLSSSMSILSDSSSGGSLPDPRLQRIRRSETVSAGSGGVRPTNGLKRAPSYGTFAQVPKSAPPNRHARNESGSYPSSDEEEKLRTKQAKKQRTKSPSTTPTPASPLTPAVPRTASTNRPDSPKPPPVPEKDRHYLKTKSRTTSPVQDENVRSPQLPKTKKTSRIEGSKGVVKEKPKASEKRPAPMNLQRNPSMFGPELPQVAKPRITIPTSPILARAAKLMSPSKVASPPPASPVPALSPSVPTPPQSPSPQTKTLRRVRRLAPARRISFGSLAMDEDVKGGGSDARSCLGSAFQLL